MNPSQTSADLTARGGGRGAAWAHRGRASEPARAPGSRRFFPVALRAPPGARADRALDSGPGRGWLGLTDVLGCPRFAVAGIRVSSAVMT